MCSRVAQSYKAGIDLRTIWKREAKRGSGSLYKQHAEDVHERVDNGQMVGEAMAQANGYFPDLTVAVTTAGEKGGRLESSFALLAEHYTTMIRFRNQVLLSIAWPLFQLGFTIVFLGLMILVMGFIAQLAGIDEIDWLGLGLSTGQYFWLYVFFVAVALTAMFLVYQGIRLGWFGLAPFKLGRRLPLIGKIIDCLSLSRFAWALSVVTEAGINIKEGVRLALRATENFYYMDLEKELVEGLQQGQPLTETFENTGRFSDDFIMNVENGELTGNLPESLQKLADDYLETVQSLFKLLSTILFLVCFIIIAMIIVAAILFLFYTLVWGPTNEIMQDFGYN